MRKAAAPEIQTLDSKSALRYPSAGLIERIMGQNSERALPGFAGQGP